MSNQVKFEEVKAPLSVSEIEIDRELADRSFAEFFKMAWHVIEPGKELLWNWHLDCMCLHLEESFYGRLLRLLITIPPGSSKSVCVGIMWPAWIWTKRPDYRFLCCANESSLSVRDSLRCRRLIDSDWYKQRWGHKFKLSSDNSLKSLFENDKSGWRESTTTTSNVAGKKADFLILDDPQDAHKVQSELYRRETKDWWIEAFRNRVNDFTSSRRVIIGQRVHEDDLIAHIIKTDSFEHIMLPEEYESSRKCFIKTTGWEDPRRTEGELLRPKQYGVQQVEEYKKTARYWATQHQQRPISKAGEMFKREWFYDKMVDSVPENKTIRVRYWDKAASSSSSADYTVGLLLAKSAGIFYIEDMVRGQWEVHKREQKILETAKLDKERYGNVRTYIEVDPGAAGKESGLNTLRNLAGFSVELNPIAGKGDKATRAEGACDQCGGGNVYIKKAHWNEVFLEELCAFPHGSNDDAVDAFSGSFNKLVKFQAPFHSSPLYLFPQVPTIDSEEKNKSEKQYIPIDDEEEAPRPWWKTDPLEYTTTLKKRFPWMGN